MREIIRLSFNGRFRKILFLFLSFVMQFWWLSKIKRFLSEEALEKKYRDLYKLQATKFTNTAIDFGGLLIKLGQFFSSRVDILPKEYTDELAKLQDSVKPEKTELIMKRLKEELGSIEKNFSSISQTALAAASLGQVHQATLISGEKVAVKVLRPGIEDIIAIDIEALKRVVALAKRNEKISTAVDLDQIFKEFTDIVIDELDYEKEGLNADNFRESFSNHQDIKIPQIYWELTTKNVLTMEFVEGIKINEFDALRNQGANLERVAEIFFSSYLKQIMTDGFFHADPHPGNILVNKEGTLTFLDFGMVDRVQPKMREDIVDLAINVFKKDAGAIVASFDKMGFLRPHADKSTLTKSVKVLLANVFEDIDDLNKINLPELTTDLRQLMYSQPFQIPSGTLFLGKALVTVMGICNGLNPNFDMVNAAKPFVKDLFDEDMVGEGKNIVLDEAKKILADVIALPGKINSFIDGVESGVIRFQPAKSFEDRLFEQQTLQSKKIIAAVLTSGFIISGSILLDGRLENIGFGLIIFGGISALSLLFRRKDGVATKRRAARTMGTGFKKPRLHP